MIEKGYRTDDFFLKKASNHLFRCSLSKEIPKIHFILHPRAHGKILTIYRKHDQEE